MNARQKAKKYKKELECLRSMLIKPQIIYEDRHIVTIGANLVIDSSFVCPPEEFIHKRLFSQLSESDDFRNAVVIESNHNDRTLQTLYTARLQVVGR